MLCTAGAVVMLAGCATSGQVERWHLTEPKTPTPAEQLAQASAQPVRVVFFRQTQATEKAAQPINLYLNGQYQASLVGNTYTEQNLCPGAHRFAVAFNDVQRRYHTKEEGQPVNVGTDPMQYFRVTEDAAGQAVLQPAPASEAQTVRSLRLLQTHTLPRVIRNGCNRG
ncbi:MAG: hypothetical protein Q4G70_13160 [Pseudomonadota bacterium]|nr:hypothetical protein [Pseudomonadota bacterium]